MVCVKAKLLGYLAAVSVSVGFFARTRAAICASFSRRSWYRSFSKGLSYWGNGRLALRMMLTLQYTRPGRRKNKDERNGREGKTQSSQCIQRG